METILNEKKYIRKIIDENYIDPNPYNSLRLLTKFHVVNGLKRNNVYSSVLEYAKCHYLKTNKNKSNKYRVLLDEELIEEIVKKTVDYFINKKSKLQNENKELHLLEINQIHITKNELYMISMLNNIDLERLAFVMLVQSKINKVKTNNETTTDYGVYCTRDIFSESFLPFSVKSKMMINELKQTGHVSPNQESSKSVYVRLLYADTKEKSEPAIIIKDFRNFGYEYDKFRGNKLIANCKVCSVLFQKHSRNQKYCEKCKKEKELQHKRDSIKKARNKM